MNFRRHFKNLSFIWISSLLSVVSGFVNQSFLARELSVNDFGYFSSYMGFINLLIPCVGLGLTSYWLKYFGKNKTISKDLILASIIVLISSFTFTYILIVLTNKIHGFENILLLSILSIIIIGRLFSDMMITILQIKGNFLKFSIAQSSLPVIRLSLLSILFYLINSNSLNHIAIVWCISSLLVPIVFLKTVKKEIPNPFYNVKKIIDQLKSGVPQKIFQKSLIFGVTGLLYLGWSQGHIVFAKIYFGDYGAGLYSSVIILCMAISMFPNVIFSKLLAPKYHELVYSNPGYLKKIFWKSNILMFLLGCVATIITYSISDFIIEIAFGSKYIEASSILKIISLTFPMRFCGFNSGLILTTHNLQSIKFSILLVSVIFNFVIAVLLSELNGIKGLALSIFITEFLLIILYTAISNSKLNKLCTQMKNMH